jgi:3D (Asp-Asp-Asp) domain-containing protein
VQEVKKKEGLGVRKATISKAIIAALLAAELVSCTKAALMQNRITDLETQRDIYKSMYEDWKGAAGEVAGYADDLRDSLKARNRLDQKLLVEDAGEFLCTSYCTEQYEHICGTGTGITASGAPVEAGVTVAADPDIFQFGTVLYIEDVGVRIVQDRGSDIQGKHLDVAVPGSHKDALNWEGYGKHHVWIIKEAGQ